MDNKTKVDRIHDLLPKFLNTHTNTNWRGLIEALGEQDEQLAQLIAEVRKQFFIKTSSRPYIDVLAANNNISRPRLVGMSDASFRNYIPVLSYKPKQVKLIIDALLDIFFFKESTTAFIMSTSFEPFTLADGWDLQLNIDSIYQESITFRAADFTNIALASADEIVAAYNRQSKYSYATNYYDSITKHSYIRIFTNTVGSKGSIEIFGGLANIGLQLNGFITTAGNGSNTQWTVTKIGDTVTFTNTGGASPGINQLQIGDILISSLPGNSGSFVITGINISNQSYTFTNLFATTGVFTQVSANDTKYIRPDKYVAWKTPRRAIVWETQSGEVTVEMPTTPPVVQRSLKGSMHLNGDVTLMTNRDSDTSLSVVNAAGFPMSGSFWIEHVDAITTRILTPDINEIQTITSNGRLIYDVQKYTYDNRLVLNTSGSAVLGSNQITVASVAGVAVGNSLFMDGFRADAVVTNIVGLVVTLSENATATANSIPVTFCGNTLFGIDPPLPALTVLNETVSTSLSRSAGVVTVTVNNTYAPGDSVYVYGSSGINILATPGNTNSNAVLTGLASVAGVAPGQLVIATGVPANTTVVQVISSSSVLMSKAATLTGLQAIQFNENVNGSFVIQSASSTQFTYDLLGTDGTALVAGSSGIEEGGLANSGSKIILTTAQHNYDTRITGSYVWDTAAPYVLSDAVANTQDEIIAGKIVRLLNVSANHIPDQTGFIIFNYGQNSQEGPVKYLYKPAEGVLALDPSYIFLKDHPVGSPVVTLSHKGPHQMDGLAGEYGLYITDPSEARVILEALIQSVVSAGIFVNFLIRYPEQFYGTLDVYNSGTLPPV